MSDLVVVVSGTGTEVGKTYVACRLIDELRRTGESVVARKPVQSFDPSNGPTDAELLAAATGESPEEVCPRHRSYEVPMAPPMAARRLGRPPIAIKDLVAEVNLPPRGIAVVEGVGGPRSPVAEDGDTVRLTELMPADVVLVVAEAGLGAINAILSSVACFDRPTEVLLNRFDDNAELHRLNREWLETKESLRVFTKPEDLARALVQRVPPRLPHLVDPVEAR